MCIRDRSRRHSSLGELDVQSDVEKVNRELGGRWPKHVGIIMDGNGRWATRRGLPRAFGHRAGTERLRGIIRISSDLGIQALSLYAFSTENWKRPKNCLLYTSPCPQNGIAKNSHRFFQCKVEMLIPYLSLIHI